LSSFGIILLVVAQVAPLAELRTGMNRHSSAETPKDNRQALLLTVCSLYKQITNSLF